MSEGVPFIDAPASACAFIVAFTPEAPRASLVCGAPAERGRPYCAEHCADAYLPTPPLDVQSIMRPRVRMLGS